MFRKKAQAAMEFLMTYGWAILVVLAAIGALAYFGVLSPDRFLPEKCTLQSGMACTDFTWTSADGFTLKIQNSGGFDMTDVNVSLVQDNDGDCHQAGQGPTSLADGESAFYNFTGTGCTGLSGKFKGSIYVNFTNVKQV